MHNIAFATNYSHFIFFLLLFHLLGIHGDIPMNISNRETRETSAIIESKVRCGCSAPAPAPEPEPQPEPESPAPPPKPSVLQPSDFPFQQLFVAYKTIQTFKSTITSDPLNITQSWQGPDICKNYTGIFCDNPPYNLSVTTVASVDFNGFLLEAPSIDEFISQLPDLAIFHANSNRFRGTISSNITKLPYLYELDVSNNLMSGAYPDAVLGISLLIFLDLRYNSFAGAVPTQVFGEDVYVFFINNNNFNQNIPDTFWNSQISYLTFANNNFTGPISRNIRKAAETLVEVLFLNNQLSGYLPYEIGYLKEATVFDAGYNKLTGPIPFSMGCMSKLEQLNFAGNYLYGMIPEVVCALGNLENLSLSDNYFTAVGPNCKRLIKSGVLDDRKNCIPGRPLQRSPMECHVFFTKQRSCPFLSSYYIMPCKLNHTYAMPPPPPPPPPPPSGSRWRTYGSLNRHPPRRVP